jgi:threonine aldolase
MLDIAASPLSEVRNDVYGRGGVLGEFEREVASLLGMEAAVYMPSGTMAQPIALRIWSDRAGIARVAFHPTCHLEIHEQMGYRELHHLDGILLGDADRLFTLVDFLAVDLPLSTLLIELPQREIGGQLPTWAELTAICNAARSRGVRLHLDGARLWECGPYYQRSYAEICGLFDSVYVSFYKILGGLPGAMLLGPSDFIDKAKIWQRRQGGNLQQQSPSVIAAKLGLDRHLPHMPSYVAKAQDIAAILRDLPGVCVVPEYPPTNMMHVYFAGDADRINDAALRIAEEDRVWLFQVHSTTDGAKFELNVGAAAMELTEDRIRGLFEKLFDQSSTEPAGSESSV